jgi:hypothetical protein
MKYCSKVLFRKFAKFIRNGTSKLPRDRAVSNARPSETVSDRIDGTVGHPTRHADSRARAARLIFKPKREIGLAQSQAENGA